MPKKFPSDMSFRSTVLDTDKILIRESAGVADPQYTTPAALMAGRSLTIGTTSATAARGDQGLTAYNHSQVTHAPTNAQKNSDITRAEIEVKVGVIPTTYAPTNAQKNSDITKAEIEAKLTGAALTSHGHPLPLFSTATAGYVPTDTDLIWIERGGVKYQWSLLGLKDNIKAYMGVTPIVYPNALYVAKTGSDTNVGTYESPLLTIQVAVNKAVAGDTIIVEDGVYTITGDFCYTSKSGTAGAPITIKARNKGMAVLNGNNNASEYGFYFDNAHYFNVEGFEIKGTATMSIAIVNGCTGINIRDCHIHDNGRYKASITWGLDAIYCKQSSDIMIERCLIHDIGRFSPTEAGSVYVGEFVDYWKDHDHGAYIEGCDRVTIQNNIFYNMNRGFSLQIYSGAVPPLASSYVKFLHNTSENGNYNATVQGHVVLYGHLSNSLVANNLFKDQASSAIHVAQVSYTYSNVIVANNMCMGGNAVYGTATGVTITGNINNANPLFIDEANHNYKLSAGSPAIAVGYAAGVTKDYDNATRVNNDIGAYKY